MTLQDQFDYLTHFLEFDLDNFEGESPSSAEMVKQLNWAKRDIARKLMLFEPSSVLTLDTSAALHDLSDVSTPRVSVAIWKPTLVVVGGNVLYGANRKHGIWSMRDLQRSYPNWRTATAATPQRAAYAGDYKLYLTPSICCAQ